MRVVLPSPGDIVADYTAEIRRGAAMLEVATLNVRAGEAADSNIFRATHRSCRSYRLLSHEFRRCIERPGRYILLVKWRTLEDHTVGFRGSAAYQSWKARLHHYYDPFPTVEHYESIPP